MARAYGKGDGAARVSVCHALAGHHLVRRTYVWILHDRRTGRDEQRLLARRLEPRLNLFCCVLEAERSQQARLITGQAVRVRALLAFLFAQQLQEQPSASHGDRVGHIVSVDKCTERAPPAIASW